MKVETQTTRAADTVLFENRKEIRLRSCVRCSLFFLNKTTLIKCNKKFHVTSTQLPRFTEESLLEACRVKCVFLRKSGKEQWNTSLNSFLFINDYLSKIIDGSD